jgi:hypothetical protein
MSNRTFAKWVHEGYLRVGTVLVHRARKHPERQVVAIVTRQGLLIGGTMYASPSAAATAIACAPANGWEYWRFKTTGERLGTIRRGAETVVIRPTPNSAARNSE